MELKCQFTGQSTANAIAHTSSTARAATPSLNNNNRVLVHFAVDLSNVYMTTRLEGGAQLLFAV